MAENTEKKMHFRCKQHLIIWVCATLPDDEWVSSLTTNNGAILDGRSIVGVSHSSNRW